MIPNTKVVAIRPSCRRFRAEPDEVGFCAARSRYEPSWSLLKVSERELYQKWRK